MMMPGMPTGKGPSITAVCVVLDTSASMNQRTSSNLTLLDAAKAAIESLVRRFPNEQKSKFLLVTTRNGGTAETSWLDSQAMFLQKVKMATARDTGDLRSTLRCAFDLLERGRSFNDIDGFGPGRQPWVRLDAASVWLLTDGFPSTPSDSSPLSSFQVCPSVNDAAPRHNIADHPIGCSAEASAYEAGQSAGRCASRMWARCQPAAGAAKMAVPRGAPL
jgi:hypothetical protein